MSTRPVTGLVLSGGGARGAYEVGVVQGIIEVLGLGSTEPSPFTVFSGTSVGAINVTYMAAHADRGDMRLKGLINMWSNLNLQAHLRFDPFGFMSFRHWFGKKRPDEGHALLDPSALEEVVKRATVWDKLYENIDNSVIRALIVPALRVSNGQTALFTETSPDFTFKGSRDPRRCVIPTRITADHILASAAIPFVFPVRWVHDDWFCDGSLRFNTPISPAIRCGVEKLVVISLLHQGETHAPEADERRYPSPVMLLGKILNAFALDPINYDLQVLERFNRMLRVLDDALEEPARARIDEVTQENRGIAYRPIETLVFSPSEDIGQIAGEHLRERVGSEQLGRLVSWFLRRATRQDATWEVDLASYVLFEGTFAQRLIELGIRDAHRKADAIRDFFGTAA